MKVAHRNDHTEIIWLCKGQAIPGTAIEADKAGWWRGQLRVPGIPGDWVSWARLGARRVDVEELVRWLGDRCPWETD